MKRVWIIVLAGLLGAGGAYWGSYRAGTACCHSLEQSQAPELAWLKAEFHLDDAEFARISQLHEAYLAGCAERCRLIDQKNEQLKRLLAATNTVTPEIQQTLAETARKKCCSTSTQSAKPCRPRKANATWPGSSSAPSCPMPTAGCTQPPNRKRMATEKKPGSESVVRVACSGFRVPGSVRRCLRERTTHHATRNTQHASRTPHSALPA